MNAHARGALRLAALASFTLLFTSACVPPKLMIADGFIPGTTKVARESIQVSGTIGTSKDSTTLTNYYVQICDVNGTVETNCKTSLVLENITDFQIQPGMGR